MNSSERSAEPGTAPRWKHGAIPVVGLTGGIGGGKSEVAAILAQRGATVIDADAVGHALLDDPRVRARIVARFGEGITSGAGRELAAAAGIDRRALAAIVFADPVQRRALEEIVHPLMRARFAAAIQQAMQAGPDQCRAVVLDAAILLEAGWDDLCDLVVFVEAPRAERLRRAARQRGWSDSAFEEREKAQWPCALKRRRAALVIDNAAGVDSLARQLDRLDELLARSPRPPLETAAERGGRATAQPAPPAPEPLVASSALRSGG
jgi:dephospho-CoA kinase